MLCVMSFLRYYRRPFAVYHDTTHFLLKRISVPNLIVLGNKSEIQNVLIRDRDPYLISDTDLRQRLSVLCCPTDRADPQEVHSRASFATGEEALTTYVTVLKLQAYVFTFEHLHAFGQGCTPINSTVRRQSDSICHTQA